eukprot:CAMPEP_0201555390 /NCGR_PEP_ID=MMETSP0173_2-20130828/48491_1 /ASSEMBLY_ACC=CAM_ASM_000268 /TAXON_ID=218659 /ORGANISM="Vexillifera sp., Strain DIVA3 564/2" /LENGTH=223 /DNA_ID=CAMNT_0047967161 /DNA_START=48 /DNA_END=719 /DNA_ORIENTATION=+
MSSSSSSSQITQDDFTNIEDLFEKDFSSYEELFSREEGTIWREPEGDGLYKYYIRGAFKDSEFTIETFIFSQTDLEFRKSWDENSKEMKVIQIDKDNKTCQGDLETIYWHVKYPWPFSDRDYVFHRCLKKNNAGDGYLSVGKATQHDQYPEKKSPVRVTSYYSKTAVRKMSSGGIEYVAEYFDDPRASIPKWLMNWAVSKLLPQYFDNLKDVCAKYEKYAETK